MKVRVLFFGATADLFGKREVDAAIGESASPTRVMDMLAAEKPELKTHKLLFAVNEEYVDGSFPLKDGDELAIFTPVSGG